jgi:hypothetical protein
MFYQITSNEGHGSVSVYDNDGQPHIATDEHPNYRQIIASLIEDDQNEDVLDLFDVSRTISAKLSRLTERISVANGVVYFDGDPVDNTISGQILRFAQQGVEDWQPLALFMENLAANPNEHSRTQLYDWLTANGEFTITEDGCILGYKGVMRDPEHGFVSISRGPAVVDGVAVNGNVPNRIGAVVEIGRSAVHHDPRVGCSTGLHVGTWEYAESFARGAVLEVHVNPRDVVSIPTDCGAQKMRCCRYTVVNIIEQKVQSPLAGFDAPTWDEDDFDWDEGDDFYDESEPVVDPYPTPTLTSGPYGT